MENFNVKPVEGVETVNDNRFATTDFSKPKVDVIRPGRSKRANSYQLVAEIEVKKTKKPHKVFSDSVHCVLK